MLLNPCYDPSEVGIPINEKLSIKDWVLKYRYVVKREEDIIWLICRPDFMSDKDLRLFAVWCAREYLKAMNMINLTNLAIIDAVNIVEKYANGLVTFEGLSAVIKELRSEELDYCTYINDYDSALGGLRSLRKAQISTSAIVDQLLTYFN